MKDRFSCMIWCTFLSVHFLTAQTPVWIEHAHPDGLQVNSVVFSNDGQSILAGTNCHPAKIRRFHAADGALSWDYTLSEEYYCMMSIALSANEQYFTSAEELGHLLVFNYTQPEPVLAQTLDLGTSYAFAVDFTPNSDKIAVGCSGGKLKLYQIDGVSLWSITAHSGWVMSVDVSAQGSLIATGGSDNKVKIWNIDGTTVRTLTGHTDDVTSVRFSPDGQRLLSISPDHTLRIWDVASGALLQTLQVGNDAVTGLALSPDGLLIATACGEEIKIWSMADYTPLDTITTSLGTITALAWSPTASALTVGTADGRIALFQLDLTNSTSTAPGTWQGLVVAPNPVRDMLIAEWPASVQVKSAALLGLDGRLLWESALEEEMKSLRLKWMENWPATVFLCLKDSAGHISTQKIMKQ